MLTATVNIYHQLCKPRVGALIVLTAVAGMLSSTRGPLLPLLAGTLGIGLAAASAAVINHVLDRRIDERMRRTRGRPLPRRQLSRGRALLLVLLQIDHYFLPTSRVPIHA